MDAGRGTGTVPKAYTNWILFDENFKYANGSFSRVGTAGTVKSHYGDASMQNIQVTKNGYLYVYVSNESPVAVFFDNLQVIHTRGPLLEETNYYPFGLSMSGISSKALKNQYAENKFKFNSGTELQNKEFSDGSGLELYETPFRSYDAQIGRFHQIDPLGEITVDWSPYTFCFDNPLLFSDPWGLEGDSTIPKSLPGATVSNTPLIPRSSPNTSPNVLKPSSAPQTSNTGSNVPGASAALTLLGTQVENPVVLGVGTVVVLATTSYVILTSDNVTTAPAIPLTGYNVRDNTGTKPITVAPPLPFPLVRIAEPEGEQYTLRARADGYYPSREWGEGINGTKWLHKGDIWKIGTTINPLTRYTQSFYKNTGAGLQYLTEFTGPLDQVLFAEKMKLLNYAIQHNGQLPPGNSKLQ